MSPPCQPFTRVGRQKDLTDERTKSFLHFIDLLPKLDKIPDYIFVENVKGFETSLTREILIEMLRKLDFVFQEFLLTPLQFSIPNSRLRYYLLAKRKPMAFCFEMQSTICTTMPTALKAEVDFDLSVNSSSSTTVNASLDKADSCNLQDVIDRVGFDRQPETGEIVESNTESHGNGKRYNLRNVVKRTVAEYLEDQPNEYFERFLLPKKFYRYFWVMDLVQGTSTNSCCFTKRYGHHIDGAGSVVQMMSSENDLSMYRNLGTVVPELSAGIEMLQLRFFTPKEIANLLCFPTQFKIPDGITTLQSYRALGNSINIRIVSVLLRLLFS